MPVTNLGTTVDSLYPPQPKSLLPLHDERDTVIQSRGGSLFGCASDCYTCCLGNCCPCALFGRTLKRSGISDSGCFGVALFALIVLLYTAGLVFGVLQFAPHQEDCIAANLVQQGSPDCMAQLTDPLAEYCTDPDGGALPAGGCPVGQQCTGVVTGQDAVMVCLDIPPPACTAGDIQHLTARLELIFHGAPVAEQQSEEALVGAACSACVASHSRSIELGSIGTGAFNGMEECYAGAQFYAGFALLAFYVVSGIVFGYYRERVKSMLVGSSSSQLTLSSFLLHCCPLTSACAFCQEARSVDNDMSSYF
jgi:Cys-rich protein (TIGR01571 family)